MIAYVCLCCTAHVQGHNEMDTFARIVASAAKPADYTRIAQYYESRGEYMKVRAHMPCAHTHNTHTHSDTKVAFVH